MGYIQTVLTRTVVTWMMNIGLLKVGRRIERGCRSIGGKRKKGLMSSRNKLGLIIRSR